ncbi:MAG: DUF5655 domain-containing protein [Treponema sp.]|nr:DUF5655 domain-containing protein [Treponema sp.]
MDTSKIVKLQDISLQNNKEIDEKYIQNYLANEPGVLGLGDLVLLAKEKIQPKAGRLDLLFQDSDTDRRYTVEIQLGKTDESHIIRAIEYWDIERKRYPQYDYCAVIIAEDITTRFLNVIQLFNGQIPLIAIQMNAFKIDDKIGIKFIKILNEVKYDIEPPLVEPTNRKYWEEIKSTKEIVILADRILGIINEIEPNFELNYNKHYIGLSRNGIPFNFVIMGAKKNFLRLDFKLEQNGETENLFIENELDVLDYNTKSNRYKIRLTGSEIDHKREIIKELLKKSYEYFK